MKLKFTVKEEQILKELRINSRKSFAALGKKLKIPTSSVYDKYKKLDKIIIKKTSLINFKKLGFPIRTIIILKTDESLNFLEQHFNINNIQKISSDNKDFLSIEVIFQNQIEKQEFYKKIKQEFVKEYEIVEEIKKENFLTN